MRAAALLRLARALPKNGRLIYCLYRDPRTPRIWKMGLIAALAVIVTPFINIPEVIPVVGELETIGLIILALEAAVRTAPADLKAEQERAIAAGESYFHHDLAKARVGAQDLRARWLG
jgi:uncharacterized membrane protein YkvA (DUF1232 family)